MRTMEVDEHNSTERGLLTIIEDTSYVISPLLSGIESHRPIVDIKLPVRLSSIVEQPSAPSISALS